MSKPIQFPEVNFTWQGWPADEKREEVLDLPAYRGEGQTISCWKLTWRERFSILLKWARLAVGHGQRSPTRLRGRPEAQVVLRWGLSGWRGNHVMTIAVAVN